MNFQPKPPTPVRPLQDQAATGPLPPQLGPADSRKNQHLRGLYERQYANLRNYLRKLVGAGPPDPDDVAQAAFAKLAGRDSFDDIENLPAFLWRTAQNILISEQRRASIRRSNASDVKEVFSGPATDDFDAERVLIAKMEVNAVLSSLKTMTAKRRAILLMSRIDGYSNAEIGRRLGLARSTVSEHLARAMMELDAVLNEAEEKEKTRT